MMECATLYKLLTETLRDIFSCTKTRDSLCITTPLMFPDGDFISVYLEETPSGNYYVTDAGELFHYLVSNQIPLTQTREQILRDILLVNTTRISEHEIAAEVTDPRSLPFAVFRVAQSVARAADMIYSRQFHLPDTFNTSVGDFFFESNIHFQESYPFTDVYGQVWTFDFRIRTGHEKLVKTLATDSRQYAEAMINRAIRQLDAVGRSFPKEYLFTIISDEDSIWRPHSLRQLEDHCIVIPFSERRLHVGKLVA